jgi:hypothetical protein
VAGEAGDLRMQTAELVAVRAADGGGRLDFRPDDGIADPSHARALDLGQVGLQQLGLPRLGHRVEAGRAHPEERLRHARHEGACGIGRGDEAEGDRAGAGADKPPKATLASRWRLGQKRSGGGLRAE